MRRLCPAALPVALALAAAGCLDDPSRAPAGRRADALGAPRAAYFVVLAGAPAIEHLPRGVDPRSAEAAAHVLPRLRAIEAQHAELRPALEQTGAVVVAELARLANVVQVLATPRQLERIRRLPGVVRVEEVPLVHPTLASLLPVVGAPAVWSKSTPLTGEGVTVGVIDSGVDYTHAHFGGPGTPAAYAANDPKIVEPGSFPTARVVGGWDFVGDDYNPSANNDVPVPDPDPLDCTKPESMTVAGGHGTHVAGIAAGNGVAKDGSPYLGPYDASFNPAAFKIAPGVAPQAKIFALRVFGCEGATTMLAAALERAADPNQDGKLDDRLDVVNGSLGTSYALSSPVLAQVVKNLSQAGTLVVAAAGNDGQTFFATGSPGSLPEVLSVAASADNELVALTVTSAASGAAEYAAAEGGFTKRLVDTGPISGTLVPSQPANGCSSFSNASAIAGKVALIDRGVCPFVTKFDNAVAAGAIAAVIVDNEDDPLPFAMGGGDPGSVPIPGVMIRLADGQTLKQLLGQGPVSVTLDPSDKYTGVGAELLAGFSSRGPSAADGRLKPEIAAPGFAIDSARVGSGSEPRRSQGTSQASPVVCGAAALVRQANPDFSPLEIKAALINSTEPLVDLQSLPYATSIVGSGRVAVERAVAQRVTAGADVAAGEVGVAFGAVVSEVPTQVERSVTVKNHGTAAITLDAKVEPTHVLPGVSVTAEPTQLAIPAGQTATLKLTLALDPDKLGSPGPDPGTAPTQSQTARQYLNEASGHLRLKPPEGGAEDVLVPYHGSVRAAAKRSAQLPKLCSLGESVEIPLAGPSAHPEPVVTAFQLGTLDDERSESATDPAVAAIDLRATGAATDLATAASFDDAQVFFAVAVSGTWTTPARGPLSVVKVEVDSDGDGSSDYEVRAEPRNKQLAYRDVLASSTYPKGSEQRIRRLPLNLVPPDIAETHPFHSSVLVFTALLKDLGLTPENTVLSYFAASEDPVNLREGEQTAWASFDAKHPVVDATPHGTDGLPLFVGPGPVNVSLSAEARAGQAPADVLLLHHTNVAGARFEVVSLAPAPAANLALAAAAGGSVVAGETADVTFTVTHAGAEPASGVKLGGSIAGGTLLSASATQGVCQPSGALDCDLGVLAPGATVTVTASVRAGHAGAVTAEATLTSEVACESSAGDNTAQVTLPISATAPNARPLLHPAGGCDCRATAPAAPTSWAWLALAGLALAALRRNGR